MCASRSAIFSVAFWLGVFFIFFVLVRRAAVVFYYYACTGMIRSNDMHRRRRAFRAIRLYSRVPPNGLVIYCGTIVTDEGKEKRMNLDFEPFKAINTSLYLCDNKFHTEVPYRIVPHHVHAIPYRSPFFFYSTMCVCVCVGPRSSVLPV